MTSADLPLDSGVCEKCGNGVHLDEEGRLACDGCGKIQPNCTCEKQS